MSGNAFNWLSRREWQALFDDPNLLITNHWYGPLMQYCLIFGGDLRPSPAETTSRRKLADFSSE